MAATLAAIRAGLAARAATIAGLRTSAYMQPKPATPMLCVLPVIPDAPMTFTGGEEMTFELWVYVQASDLVQAQKDMDQYMSSSGSKSLKTAVEADPSLGGLAGVYTRVVGWQQYASLVDVFGVQAFGAPMRVMVSI